MPKVQRSLPEDFIEDNVEEIVVDEEYYATALDGKSVEDWMQRELLHSKSALNDVTWGKRVIQAVDLDDVIKIAQLMNPKLYPSCNINLQITTRGFADYLWTTRIHDFLGDTALHMALRQKKLYATYMLLYLGADASIVNAQGISAAELCMSQFRTSHQNLKFDAKRKILDKIHPMKWKELPADFYCRHTEEEAWRLMRAGRIVYTQLPKVLQEQNPKSINPPTVISHNARKRLSFNLTFFKPPDPPKQKRERPQDVKLRKKQERLAQLELDKISQMQKDLQSKYDPWKQLQAEDGSTYFYNEETGESAWEKPQNDNNVDVTDSNAVPQAQEKVLTPEELALEEKRKEHEEKALEVHRSLLDYYKIIDHKETIDTKSQGYTEGGIYHPPTNVAKTQQQVPKKLLVNDVWNRGTIEDILKLVKQQQAYHQSLKLRRQKHQQQRHKHVDSDRHAMVVDNPLEDGAIGQTQLDRLQYYQRLIMGMVPSYDNDITQDVHRIHAHYPQEHTEEEQKLILGKFASLEEVFQSMQGLERLSLVVKNVTLPTNSNDPPEENDQSKKKTKKKTSTSVHDKKQAMLEKLATFAQEEKAKWSKDQMRVEAHHRDTVKSSPHHHHHHQSHVHMHLHHRPIRVLSTYTNLRFMHIGDLGVIALCEALHQDELVHTLILAQARMTDAALPAVQDLLHHHNETLTYLDLSGNAITSDGVHCLAEAIFHKKFLFTPAQQRKIRQRQSRRSYLQKNETLHASPFASPTRKSLLNSTLNNQAPSQTSDNSGFIGHDVSQENSLLVQQESSSSGLVLDVSEKGKHPTERKATNPTTSSFMFSDPELIYSESDEDAATGQTDPAEKEIITLMKAPIHRLNLMGNRITLSGALQLLEAVLHYNRRIYEANNVFLDDDKALLEKERLQEQYHRGGIDWVNLSNNHLSPQDYEVLTKWMEEHEYASAREPFHHQRQEEEEEEESPSSDEERDERKANKMSTVVGVKPIAAVQSTRKSHQRRTHRPQEPSSHPSTRAIRVFQHRSHTENDVKLARQTPAAAIDNSREVLSLPPKSIQHQQHQHHPTQPFPSTSSFFSTTSQTQRPFSQQPPHINYSTKHAQKPSSSSFLLTSPVSMKKRNASFASPFQDAVDETVVQDSFLSSSFISSQQQQQQQQTGHSSGVSPVPTVTDAHLRNDHRRVLSHRSGKDHLHASLHPRDTDDTDDTNASSDDSYSVSVYSDEVSRSNSRNDNDDSSDRFNLHDHDDNNDNRFRPLQLDDYRKQWRPAHKFPVILL